LQRRSALPSSACAVWSGSIQAKLLELPQYRAARSVAVYCALRNEVQTAAIIGHALAEGKKVFCPKMAGSLLFAQIFSAADLVAGPQGTCVPQGDVALGRQDREALIVVVPGVVFDLRGNRLGRGGGWYDRALDSFEDRGVFVGLAYEVQVVERIPVEHWDKKVQYVITESRVIDCGAMPRQQITW
jgi:5-formyltetrahydrofolate cyclo-ligase